MKSGETNTFKTLFTLFKTELFNPLVTEIPRMRNEQPSKTQVKPQNRSSGLHTNVFLTLQSPYIKPVKLLSSSI